MTRGTLFLVLNKSKVLASTEFNGDCYGSPLDSKQEQEFGHYRELVGVLKLSLTEKEYLCELEGFNKKHFNYKEELFYPEKLSFYSDDKKFDMDMTDDYYKKFFSDYVYVKNGQKKDVLKIQDSEKKVVDLLPHEIATFNFGKFIEKITN